jgi:hypothetical protein
MKIIGKAIHNRSGKIGYIIEYNLSRVVLMVTEPKRLFKSLKPSSFDSNYTILEVNEDE